MSENDPSSEYKGLNGPITRTRLSIAIAALLFLALVLIGEFTPLGDLIPANGITRTDVAKYRTHVLSTPALEKIENKISTLNVTATLEQLGNSNVFRAHDEHGHCAYFRLNNQFDFEEIKTQAKGELPAPDANTPSYYAVKPSNNGVAILKNDAEIAAISKQEIDQAFAQAASGDNDQGDKRLEFDSNDCQTFIINYGKSAVVYSKGKNGPSCFFIADLSQPKVAAVPQLRNIVRASADRYGKQFFVLTDPSGGSQSSTTLKLIGVNFDSQKPGIAKFDIPASMDTRLFHCAPAGSLALVDKEKLSVIDSSKGRSLAVHYFRDLIASASQKQGNPAGTTGGGSENGPGGTSSFGTTSDGAGPIILPGVPAAIFGGDLIDMRSGEIVDNLYGFSSSSVFAVDYNNKKMYYSAQQTGSKDAALMSVNVYDLHEVNFQFQVTLGSRSIVKDEALERHDYIKQLFVSQDGKLIALSAPMK